MIKETTNKKIYRYRHGERGKKIQIDDTVIALCKSSAIGYFKSKYPNVKPWRVACLGQANPKAISMYKCVEYDEPDLCVKTKNKALNRIIRRSRFIHSLFRVVTDETKQKIIRRSFISKKARIALAEKKKKNYDFDK